VKGPCGIVAQDCPAGQECVLTQASQNTYSTTCQKTTASEILPRGSLCCPNGGGVCSPGLQCLGPACDDASGPTSHCAPACCDDTICGTTSDGIEGHCDTNVAIGSTVVYQLCTYTSPCKLFHIVPCSPAFACIVKDNLGTSKCDALFQVPGSFEGATCQYANECADGLMCLGAGICSMLCLLPNPTTKPPFGTNGLDGGPFTGGCNTGKTCSPLDPTQFPGWLGACL